MTHEEALAHLAVRLNYESRGMPDLAELRVDRTAMLLDQLGRPHDHLRIIHVAGTKGKGSTSTMIATLLQEAGLTVGLHTSPHLVRIEERFRVNGKPLAESDFAELLSEIWPAVERVDELLAPEQSELTFFEITTALTLLHFHRQRVDAAVIEVGMGGRLDSTNVVEPAVSVITSISLDHTRQLGNTLEAIALEKAGIIKPGVPVVTAVTEPGPLSVITREAERQESPLLQLGRDFNYRATPLGLDGSEMEVTTWRRRWPALKLPLIGPHQCRNAATALATIDALEQFDAPVPAPIVGKKLAELSIPGRFEILARQPLIVMDVAHNPASFEAIARTLRDLLPASHQGRRVLLFATSRDKNASAMLHATDGLFTDIVLTQYQGNQRALPTTEIDASSVKHETNILHAHTPLEAWRMVRSLTNSSGELSHSSRGPAEIGVQEDVILIAGSFFLVAELMESIGVARLFVSPS